MPKKTVKKTETRKKVEKIEQPIEQPKEEVKKLTGEDLKKIVQTRYTKNSIATRLVWTITFIVLAAVLVIWVFDFKMQLSNISWQNTSENQLVKDTQKNWSKSIENLKNKSFTEQINTAIKQVAESFASSTASTTVATSTTSTIIISTSTTSTNE